MLFDRIRWKLAASQKLTVAFWVVAHGRDMIISHARSRDGHLDWLTERMRPYLWIDKRFLCYFEWWTIIRQRSCVNNEKIAFSLGKFKSKREKHSDPGFVHVCCGDTDRWWCGKRYKCSLQLLTVSVTNGIVHTFAWNIWIFNSIEMTTNFYSHILHPSVHPSNPATHTSVSREVTP